MKLTLSLEAVERKRQEPVSSARHRDLSPSQPTHFPRTTSVSLTSTCNEEDESAQTAATTSKDRSSSSPPTPPLRLLVQEVALHDGSSQNPEVRVDL